MQHGSSTISDLRNSYRRAILIGIGAMILPTLRARDARVARERAVVAAPAESPAPAAAEGTAADESGADEPAIAGAPMTTPPASPGSDSEVQSESETPQSESANPS